MHIEQTVFVNTFVFGCLIGMIITCVSIGIVISCEMSPNFKKLKIKNQ